MTKTAIAILLFDGFTALDVTGPWDVLSRIPNVEMILVGKRTGEYQDINGMKIVADHSIDIIRHADVLLLPGGIGTDRVLKDREIISWIQQMDKTTRWTVSVCAGSLLLAEAGLLDGKACTTHWRRKDQLKRYCVKIKDDRYVQDGKYLTSAGVSAGIDMSLFLISKMVDEQTARMAQLLIEYDPKPPFDTGSPEKAPKELIDKLLQK